MPRCSPGRLERYGDLMVRGAAGYGNRAGRVEGDIARMPGGGGGKADAGMMQRERIDVVAA